ncbi:MAG: thiol:disulfide interchange protein [Betaproteobacteria bacterium RBG_16_56_24]|nr:MAG: thiol:disulfide interchange protein [Betaproteobacteria bacterium RBG_16_56_24]
MMRYILPFVIFMVLAVFLYIGLGLDPHEVPSPLINKPAPAFALPQLHDPSRQFSPQDMKGQVWLLNFWASWCVACKTEHPVFMALARQNIVPVYGVDYKDKREHGQAWLRDGGDPYVMSVSDMDGRIGIDYGVYGVPETYVIDKEGVIRYKQIGVVTQQNLREKILPLVAELQAK